MFISILVLTAVGVGLYLTVPAKANNSRNHAKENDRVITKARRQLEIADVEMGKVSPPTQATVLLGLARAYSRIDKKKSLDLLERAYELSLHINEIEAPGISIVQNDVITEFARVAPEHVEQNMPADPQLRDAAANELIRYYTKDRAFGRAIELLQTVSDPDWAARGLLLALTDNDERNRVFGIVLESYRRRGFVSPGRGTDMGALLVQFWRGLRPELVNEAADELLNEANPASADTHPDTKLAITASSPAGAVLFDNYYEFRLFQLLPILKVTDSIRADELLRDNAQLKPLLVQFPQGQQSLDPTMRDTPLKEGEGSKVTYAIVRPGTSQSVALRTAGDQVANAIVRSAADAPEAALERAKALNDSQLRVRALMAVAEQVVESDPGVARSALRVVLDAQTAPFLQAAKLFLRMKDLDHAKKAVERGMAAADATYKQDNNPDDPNEAIRLLWPSVQAWRDLIDVANTISPDFALELIDGLPDAEAKTLERTFLAGQWLGVSPWASTSPFVMHKPKK